MEGIEFDIDSFIGEGGYSHRYVKSYLNAAGKKPVVCHVCSLGGCFMTAINIMDQFAAHGDVTIDISGYAASAATLIGLGAKHTRISNLSFYLIHKVMSHVDALGTMNEDQITALIADLEKVKDENEKMTLQAAKAYAEKSGKSILQILNLMKEEKWLTADEAKEWGFVDEVYTTTAKRMDMTRVADKLNRIGLPVLPVGRATAQDNLVNKIIDGIRMFVAPDHSEPLILDNHNNNQINMKKFEKLNAALGVDALECADGKGVYLNEAQLQDLDKVLSRQAVEIEDGKNHQANYADALTKLNALHPDVAAATDFPAKMDVVVAKLAEKPGVAPSGMKKNQVPTADGVDWEKMNSLPHMQEDLNTLV